MRLYKKNFVWLFLGLCITLIFLPGLPFSGNLTQTNHNLKLFIPKNAGYVVSPITINSNLDFSTLSFTEPWCYGSGTPSSPYIIENLTISGSECFFIRNTNVHFIIRNCSLYSPSQRAIVLNSVSNGKILNNEILNEDIMLWDSDHINITGNTLYKGSITVRASSAHNIISNNTIISDSKGIECLDTSTDITISNNIIDTTNPTFTGAFGVLIYTGFSDVKIFNNTFYGQGIWIEDQSLGHSSSHTIPKGNKVNGKHIYYYKNEIGLNSADFLDAGQILLVNCSLSDISNLDLSFSGVGVSLYYCDQNNFSNCNSSQISSSKSYYGIYLYNSDNNTLSGIFVNGACGGVFMEYSCDFNTIAECRIFQTNNRGIVIQRNSNNNTIKKNWIEDCWDGGILMNTDCLSNKILHNHIINDDRGISITSGCHFTLILNNTVAQNDFGIFVGTDNNLIYLNYFYSNIEQAEAYYSNNKWDNGSIGNYWDNYNGKDLNDDGIGDIPYNIPGDGGSMDSFPIWWDPLVISVISPLEHEVFREAPAFDISIADGIINTTSYSIDNGLFYMECNLTGIVDQALWNAKLDGDVNLTFFANDTSGMITNKLITIIKDTTPPLINIISPLDHTVFTENPPAFYLVINDTNLESTWYRNNITLVNVSFSGSVVNLTQEDWDSLPEGEISFTFYARDVVGNIGMTSVIVIKSEQAIPGYNLFLLFGFISISAILIKKQKKRDI